MAYCIVFVGNGDAGREIMAKAILDERIHKTGSVGIEVKARGLVVLFQEPVNSKVIQILESNRFALQYDCVFQLEQSDIDNCDLVIAMDETQKKRVLEVYQGAAHVYTLKELAGEEGSVLDPYGKELIDYEYCFRELSRLIDKIGDNYLGLASAQEERKVDEE
jgi:protein-tyrosine-phosphatase